MIKKIFSKLRNYFSRQIIDNQREIIDNQNNYQKQIIDSQRQIIDSQRQIIDSQNYNQREIIDNQNNYQRQIIENQRQELYEVETYLSLLIYLISRQQGTQYGESDRLHHQNDKFRLIKNDSILKIQDKIKLFIEVNRINDTIIKIDFSDEAYKKASNIFDLLTPMDVFREKKVRLGGNNDGSYVTIEPEFKNNNDGIAYSFGISTSDPWSLEMVKRGYEVFQYDGTIEKGPYDHPMIHFFKFMITGSPDTKQNEKNIGQILTDHGHHEKNIMLNIDIEGAEWDFFESITRNEMLQFEQIIVEFHDFSLNDKDLSRKISILKKINETHQCIHMHGNNCASMTILRSLYLLPSVIEVSYIRKDPKYKFKKCFDEFPGELDFPNAPFLPDIYLGSFNVKNNESI